MKNVQFVKKGTMPVRGAPRQWDKVEMTFDTLSALGNQRWHLEPVRTFTR